MRKVFSEIHSFLKDIPKGSATSRDADKTAYPFEFIKAFSARSVVA